MMLMVASGTLTSESSLGCPLGKILSLSVPQFVISENETDASEFVECSKSVIHTGYRIMAG